MCNSWLRPSDRISSVQVAMPDLVYDPNKIQPQISKSSFFKMKKVLLPRINWVIKTFDN